MTTSGHRPEPADAHERSRLDTADLADLVDGLRLARRGEWFAAHEAWERAWRRSAGAERAFWQGMVHGAVALVHAARGNRRGASSQLDKAAQRLGPFAAVHHGVHVHEWCARLERFGADPATASGVGGPVPGPELAPHLEPWLAALCEAGVRPDRRPGP